VSEHLDRRADSQFDGFVDKAVVSMLVSLISNTQQRHLGT